MFELINKLDITRTFIVKCTVTHFYDVCEVTYLEVTRTFEGGLVTFACAHLFKLTIRFDQNANSKVLLNNFCKALTKQFDSSRDNFKYKLIFPDAFRIVDKKKGRKRVFGYKTRKIKESTYLVVYELFFDELIILSKKIKYDKDKTTIIEAFVECLKLNGIEIAEREE